MSEVVVPVIKKKRKYVRKKPYVKRTRKPKAIVAPENDTLKVVDEDQGVKMVLPSVKYTKPTEIKDTKDNKAMVAFEEHARNKERLKLMYMRHPNLMNIKCPTKIKLDKMSSKEILERLAIAKIALSSGLNNQISAGVIGIANVVIDKFTGCLKELTEITNNDPYLKQSLSDELSLGMFDYIPGPIRIAGIYAGHVVKAIMLKKKKQGYRKPVVATPGKPVRTVVHHPVPKVPTPAKKNTTVIKPPRNKLCKVFRVVRPTNIKV